MKNAKFQLLPLKIGAWNLYIEIYQKYILRNKLSILVINKNKNGWLVSPGCSENPGIAINEIVLLDFLVPRNARLERKTGIWFGMGPERFALNKKKPFEFSNGFCSIISLKN